MVDNNKLAMGNFEKMDRGLIQDFHRDFQMQRLHFDKNSKQKDLEHFSIYHIPGKDAQLNLEDLTKRTLNKTTCCGRNFIDDNFSVPWGYQA